MANEFSELIKDGVESEGGGMEKTAPLNITEARKELREIVDRVVHGSERITLSRYGKPAAVLVSVEDAELLEMLENQTDLEAIREVLRNPKPVSWSKAKAQLGL